MNDATTTTNSKTSKLGAALLAAVLSLALLALSACSARDLAGTWAGQSTYTDAFGFKYDVPVTLTIAEDGSCSMNIRKNGQITGWKWGDASVAGTCDVSGTDVALYLNGFGNLHMEFAMSSNGKQTLTMADNNLGVVELTKVSS